MVLIINSENLITNLQHYNPFELLTTINKYIKVKYLNIQTLTLIKQLMKKLNNADHQNHIYTIIILYHQSSH